MPKIARVALVLATTSTYGRDVLRGIYHYMLPHKSWAIRRIEPAARSLSTLEYWDPDGIIAQVDTPELRDALASLKKPLVDVAGALSLAKRPQVRPDDRAVGRLAAEYFLEKGFTHLAYFSKIETAYSLTRQRGFVQYLAEHRITPHVLDAAGLRHRLVMSNDTPPYDDAVRQWLASLPQPVGVFACDDAMGFELAEFCRLSGLRVPEQVSLLGVDNDELLCALSHPALSSIRQPVEQIGYAAARLLGRLMAGKRAPRRPVLLKPLGVVARQSSSILAIGDPELAQAIQFIHQHAHEPMTVEDILAAVPLSRRALEQRFRERLGRSPLQEILRLRVERAKQLLDETDMKLAQVGSACGFDTAPRLCKVFRHLTGATPGQYRARNRVT